MPSTRDIRRRIGSVKNTKQITKAMEMVAAAKMKKAQDQALNGRPFAQSLNRTIVSLKENAGDVEHPLLEARDGKRDLVIVINTDKGLCGGLNSNLLKAVTIEAQEHGSAGGETTYVTVGRKLRTACAKSGHELLADFTVGDPVGFAETKLVSEFAVEQFLEGSIDRVRVAFTNFVTTLTQEPAVETLLPINPIHLGKKKDYEGMSNEGDEEREYDGLGAGYLFEPTAKAVFEATLPMYVSYQVYQMILEARASEHSSRMVAMKNATENADGLIKDLTLEYNKLRQAAITNELLEITTAMKALE